MLWPGEKNKKQEVNSKKDNGQTASYKWTCVPSGGEDNFTTALPVLVLSNVCLCLCLCRLRRGERGRLVVMNWACFHLSTRANMRWEKERGMEGSQVCGSIIINVSRSVYRAIIMLECLRQVSGQLLCRPVTTGYCLWTLDTTTDDTNALAMVLALSLSLSLSLSPFFLPFSGQNNFSLHTSTTALLYARNAKEYNNAFCDTDLLCLCICVCVCECCVKKCPTHTRTENTFLFSCKWHTRFKESWCYFHQWYSWPQAPVCVCLCELKPCQVYNAKYNSCTRGRGAFKGLKTTANLPTARKARFFSSNSGQCGNWLLLTFQLDEGADEKKGDEDEVDFAFGPLGSLQ